MYRSSIGAFSRSKHDLLLSALANTLALALGGRRTSLRRRRHSSRSRVRHHNTLRVDNPNAFDNGTGSRCLGLHRRFTLLNNGLNISRYLIFQAMSLRDPNFVDRDAASFRINLLELGLSHRRRRSGIAIHSSHSPIQRGQTRASLSQEFHLRRLHMLRQCHPPAACEAAIHASIGTSWIVAIWSLLLVFLVGAAIGSNIDTACARGTQQCTTHRGQELAVPGHWQLGYSCGTARTLHCKLRVFGLGGLGESVWPARPATDGKSLKDIVVDLAGARAVGTAVEMSARARGSDLQRMLAGGYAIGLAIASLSTACDCSSKRNGVLELRARKGRTAEGMVGDPGYFTPTRTLR